jgi:hypothetical protein
MKKMIALSAMVLLLLTGTSAFAETDTAKKMSDGLYNGITYFDMGTAYACSVAATDEFASSRSTLVLNNGITFFGSTVEGSKTMRPCSAAIKSNSAWPKNGITNFS